jgi:hypothetical protein
VSAPSERPTWLVLAVDSGCCGHVQLSIFERAMVSSDPAVWEAGFDGADPESEVVLSGPDWRPLLIEAATELARRESKLICAQCAVAYVKDDAERLSVENEAARILYALPKERSNGIGRRR